MVHFKESMLAGDLAATSFSQSRDGKVIDHLFASTTLAPKPALLQTKNMDVESSVPATPQKYQVDIDPISDFGQLDGGLTAWSQVFVSFLLVVNSFGYFSSFGLFESHWVEVLDATESQIAWVGSVSLFLLFMLGTLSGSLMDKGHFRSLIFIGCSFQILGAFTTSAISQYWQLILAQGVVQGIGNGLLFTPCVTLVSVYFSKRRAFALSVAACGAPIGGIIFPLVCVSLVKPFPPTLRSHARY